ncbi:uncharacterized protein BDZ83DRAFT_610791 [Colletotrichum acutatum]|uniref:Uncharacterized protein n=1 Tax=Glomerella acutata TaxID=27357 RepID=A0AAD8UR72_GLOAC|nr:uncharacterized protein BDZ83DRAFT_610791 [Colletotrichum acutatum]KAK1727968.1 hypothetical protein BDZ83DRAFT_610791 [Colletotrichum acutatum]
MQLSARRAPSPATPSSERRGALSWPAGKHDSKKHAREPARNGRHRCSHQCCKHPIRATLGPTFTDRLTNVSPAHDAPLADDDGDSGAC